MDIALLLSTASGQPRASGTSGTSDPSSRGFADALAGLEGKLGAEGMKAATAKAGTEARHGDPEGQISLASMLRTLAEDAEDTARHPLSDEGALAEIAKRLQLIASAGDSAIQVPEERPAQAYGMPESAMAETHLQWPNGARLSDDQVELRLDERGEPRLDDRAQRRLPDQAELRLDQRGELRLTDKAEPRLDQRGELRLDDRAERHLADQAELRLDQRGEPRLDDQAERSQEGLASPLAITESARRAPSEPAVATPLADLAAADRPSRSELSLTSLEARPGASAPSPAVPQPILDTPQRANPADSPLRTGEAPLPGSGEPLGDSRSEGRPEGLAGLSANSTASGAPSTPSAPQGNLPAPLASPAWPGQLGQQLVMLGQRGGEQRVELHLNPAELGPLSISLKVGEQGAQAQFLSAHASVRQAVEQAIPQLREALAEQGISLSDTSVGEHPQQQGEQGQQGMAFNRSSGQAGGADEMDASDAATGLGQASFSDGRVDLYA